MSTISRDLAPNPILPCRGGLCPPERPALHRFVALRERREAGSKYVTHVDPVYRCEVCANERTWGALEPASLAVLH